MTNYRGLLFSLAAIAGTATAAVVVYRFATRGVRPSDEDDAEAAALNGRQSELPPHQPQEAADGSERELRDEQAEAEEGDEEYEEIEDAEHAAGQSGAEVLQQQQQQQLVLVTREGSMMLSVFALVMMLIVAAVGVVLAWTSEDNASVWDLPMFAPLLWIAFGVFTASSVDVLSTPSAATPHVVDSKAVFPHDDSDFELIRRFDDAASSSSPNEPAPSLSPSPSSPIASRAAEADESEEKDDVPHDLASIISRAEALFAENQHRATREFLRSVLPEHPNEIDVLWRLARACNYLVDEASSTDDKKALAFEGLGYADTAYAVDANSAAANKWKGIMTGSTGNFRDLKDKIAGAYVIREHIERAIALDPQDATCHNILGQWCLAFADMTWIEKRAAAALFGTPPTATYDEALTYLLAAEEISPGFWKKNVFLIAQTYHKMKRDAEAREWLRKARAVDVKTSEDEQVEQDIAALMRTLRMA
ncbi:hypothetical protein P43SY_005517 [Pythium insidiosum]|uniref:Regulator of microtubule dynamics protein 1 n=1 Tax=Pythium insidiosum TaxID=114742 RepID=A0AAD5M8J7_PYTIN|nr:hypothetical protein P43SY_005517 [Pythium insidiosum]